MKSRFSAASHGSRKLTLLALIGLFSGFPCACNQASDLGTLPAARAAAGGASGATAAGGTIDRGPYLEPPDPVDVSQIPRTVPTVSLTVAAADIQTLEAAPFADKAVPATFTDAANTQYAGISAHYRGAYALQKLIQSGLSQRNWKLKFTAAQKYRNRREWNFTYEPDLRQLVAYDLMHLAGVRLPTARPVLLAVNGRAQGLYLEYEDPDNKPFLTDQFGDDSGDLYKAAQDLPDQPRYFATLEVLGTTDADYYLHYSKKTNNDSSNAGDFSRLRSFIRDLNTVPDAGFTAWLEEHFDVPKLISYLVVSNFVSNWDGYPHRPKNFWLYEIPWAAHWVFIPWDLDSTFQSQQFWLNAMGTTASVFYQFDQTVSYGGHAEEGTERPLVRRAMRQPTFRAAYVARYRKALESFLAADSVLSRIDALHQLMKPLATGQDGTTLEDSTNDMRAFVRAKHDAVVAELGRLP